jgi:transketolase
MFAPFHKINNLTLIVDYNRLQLDGFVTDILDISPLGEKFKAFNWHVIEVDGHDMQKVLTTLKEVRANVSDKPTCIIAHTVKGKGVSFMENSPEWHGVAPKPEQVEAAVKELEAAGAR